METFSALLAICVGNSPIPGEFPTQRPVTRSFDVFFDLHPNKRLSKQWWGWWFETLSRPLWRHRNVDIDNSLINICLPGFRRYRCSFVASIDLQEIYVRCTCVCRLWIVLSIVGTYYHLWYWSRLSIVSILGITLASRERYLRQHDCLLKSLYILTTKTTPKRRITGPLWRKPQRVGLPSQRTSNARSVSVSWRHRGSIFYPQMSEYPC